jgi:hypothetical protein
MTYFNKGENLYYKIDAETFTVYEVFGSDSQKRIMLNTGERFYTDVMDRTERDSFTETDEAAFTTFLNQVKASL